MLQRSKTTRLDKKFIFQATPALAKIKVSRKILHSNNFRMAKYLSFLRLFSRATAVCLSSPRVSLRTLEKVRFFFKMVLSTKYSASRRQRPRTQIKCSTSSNCSSLPDPIYTHQISRSCTLSNFTNINICSHYYILFPALFLPNQFIINYSNTFPFFKII